MIFKIIIILASLVLLIWLTKETINLYKQKDWGTAISTTIIVVGIVITICIAILGDDNSPKPIDVYRNKTELRINGYYQDSTFIPTDSTVIWKNKN